MLIRSLSPNGFQELHRSCRPAAAFVRLGGAAVNGAQGADDAGIQRVRRVRSVIVSKRSCQVLAGAMARWAVQGLPEAAHSSLS